MDIYFAKMRYDDDEMKYYIFVERREASAHVGFHTSLPNTLRPLPFLPIIIFLYLLY